MGQVVGRCRELKTKIRELEEEREGARRVREAESRAFAGREEEWLRERRRLLLEAARLRSRIKEVQQQEEDQKKKKKKKKKKTKTTPPPPPLLPKAEAAAAAAVVVEKEEEEEEEEEEVKRSTREEEAEKAAREQQVVVVERMKEEQRRREEAVEKWKQLYLAIKAELDDLIQRTTHHQGERFCWGAAEQQQGMIEALQRELKAREETVESLRLKISSMEKEGVRRDREIDILRQSLRILSYSKRNHRASIRRSLPRGLHM